MKLPTAAQASAKWATVTPQRTQEYQDGVQNPKTPWAAATAAAKDAYKAGITEALARDAFSKGVAAAGDAKYTSATLAKGPARFAEGVQLGQNTYAAKIAPVLQTIASTQLPPRFAKGDLRNIERVKVISQALRKLKTTA